MTLLRRLHAHELVQGADQDYFTHPHDSAERAAARTSTRTASTRRWVRCRPADPDDPARLLGHKTPSRSVGVSADQTLPRCRFARYFNEPDHADPTGLPAQWVHGRTG